MVPAIIHKTRMIDLTHTSALLPRRMTGSWIWQKNNKEIKNSDYFARARTQASIRCGDLLQQGEIKLHTWHDLLFSSGAREQAIAICFAHPISDQAIFKSVVAIFNHASQSCNSKITFLIDKMRHHVNIQIMAIVGMNRQRCADFLQYNMGDGLLFTLDFER